MFHRIRLIIKTAVSARYRSTLSSAALAVVCTVMQGGGNCSAANFSIAVNGRAAAEIVIEGDRVEAPVSFAAEELQRYVKLMSGAELAVGHTTSRKPSIVLATKRFQQAVDDPRERDHYHMKADGRNLRIEGGTARAVLFGAYDVLERLGCGWCVPGDDTIPKKQTLKLPALDVDTRPAFEYRMMLDFPLLTVAQSLAITDWIAKNRLNWVRACANAHGEPKAWYDRRERVVPALKKRGLGLLFGGHTMGTWVGETNFASHPEWFALHDGARKKPTLCLSHPEVFPELIKNMRGFLDRCPEAEVVDFWHTDGVIFCHCAKCTRGTAAASEKDPSMPTNLVQAAYIVTYVEFINRVAEALGKSHPKVMLGPLIYSQTDHALPDAAPALADNVLMGMAHFYRDSYRPLVGEPKSAINLRFLGNDLTWIAKSKHSYIYEYYNGWVPPYVYPGAEVIVRDLQTLEALQIQGASSDMYGYSPINMYVAARAMWSPKISWKEAVGDFCARYFGDVATEMAENEIRLETGIFGLNGYQSAQAREPETTPNVPASGRYLQKQRPGQVTLLKTLIAKTKDPQVKVRLERALKPWELWNKEPRFWAFPDFKD